MGSGGGGGDRLSSEKLAEVGRGDGWGESARRWHGKMKSMSPSWSVRVRVRVRVRGSCSACSYPKPLMPVVQQPSIVIPYHLGALASNRTNRTTD